MTSPNPTVAALVERSNRLGSDPKNTNYAGGNTSAKGTEVDPVTGEDVELVWVKGSGGDLGTLTESGLAVLRLDRMRALTQRLPRCRARGRDGRGVRLLPARQGRRGTVDRHRDARPGRLRPRRPPAPRLRHRDRDGRRRRGADQGDLRRQGRLGAVATSGLPARPRHRRDQGGQPAGRRLHPRRPRHHRLGRDLARSPRRTASGSSTPPRPTSPSTPRPSPSDRRWTGTPPSPRPSVAPRPPPSPRPSAGWRPPTGRWSATSPTPTWSSTSSARPSTRAWPASAPRAPTTSCAPRSSRWCVDLPATASVEETIARLKELHGPYREDYQGYYDRNATATTLIGPRSVAPTR